MIKARLYKQKTKGGFHQMLMDFAWNAFEYTGNIDSYIFYREIAEKNTVKEQQRRKAEGLK